MGTPGITPREEDVLRLIAAGKSTKQVAYEMGIKFKTAATHRNNLLAKFHASNTAEMMMRAVALDLLAPVRNGDPAADSRQSAQVQDLLQKMRHLTQENRRSREALSAELAEARNLIKRSSEARKEFRKVLSEVHSSVQSLSRNITRP